MIDSWISSFTYSRDIKYISDISSDNLLIFKIEDFTLCYICIKKFHPNLVQIDEVLIVNYTHIYGRSAD